MPPVTARQKISNAANYQSRKKQVEEEVKREAVCVILMLAHDGQISQPGLWKSLILGSSGKINLAIYVGREQINNVGRLLKPYVIGSDLETPGYGHTLPAWLKLINSQ